MITERYELSCDRIKEIAAVQETAGDFREYFKKTADFILQVADICQNPGKTGELESLMAQNRALYEDILGDQYETSYANPSYACSRLGRDFGQLLSFLYTEIRAMIPYAYEARLEDMAIRMELFVEVYNAFAYAYSEAALHALPEKAAIPEKEEIRETLYWFVSDYSETASQWRVRTQVDADCDFAAKIIMESDLNDIRYLYQYGEFVSPEIEQMAQYLNSLPEERIQMIADTYTEGYRIGFVKGNKDLSKKETVDIRYMLGFERIVRAAIQNFAKMGLRPAIYRASNSVFHKKGVNKIGYFGADANKQFLYDHKDDIALFLDKKLVNRRLEVLKLAYEEVKDKAAKYAGPAVIEVFGETPFAPVSKKEACSLSAEQQKLSAEYTGASADIVNRYIIGEERSFTIIAFPVPDIGEHFAEIFDETVKLNTLDYTTYERIQAAIIDTLNKTKYVEIKGMNGNRTDLRVALYPISDPEKEAIFENCVADVNIPVGEVFTSPVLEGTNGKLHVSRVFLNELEYHNLEIDFQDGMIADYTCTNFDSEEENKAYVKENVLYNHDTLPMGEFAIGTNTTAYMTAKKYNIANLFPILIAEKTGPHFAVGDTCYSRSEDVRVYNEDGREIVAKDNSVSVLRKTDPSKAYFACHTDITIPYDELGSIIAYDQAGNAYTIIEKGRFVLEGTEELNAPFD
ncbi:MAG: aminopeptidase [Lachnospiraceae bacterium]|nr:aminopeptidase [Lachnospiraceae bacterium]